MSRLDRFLRQIVSALPWYDSAAIEERHARTAEVRAHSIVARREAERVPEVRALREMRRLETVARRSR